ncbi:alginate O-acetyltransferase AlgX-related protein [Pseudodonghicola xiamenensis]|uniref:AlgX/AlgJ SGNH hydrolase-like domain-containing protein n=1 Tax=Pseudodonghicola xiamenensis TaxID=337702 RepID=A0A8J3HB19_9RHOB|nr:hypothetical protein [Pseudodonghicola xiamenensis]GHG97612.1 hypothetical protein GCM10010961_32450 [Pseudodonghicola xiamenensis]
MTDSTYEIENAVLIGEHEELYLAAGAHSILKFATGELTVPEQSVRNFWQNLRERAAFCARQGRGFLQMVAPEKYKVHPEGFPVENPKSFWDAFTAAEGATVENMWYGAQDLRDNPFGRSYYKTDTHWTAAGMMLATRRIAETAGFSEVELSALSEKMQAQTQPLDKLFYGDLGRKLEPQQGEEALWPRRAPSVTSEENGLAHDYDKPVNDGRMVVSYNPDSVTDKTLLIFGDSYLFNGLAYVELGFRNMVFCRTRFFHREMVAMVQPDMVVCEAAERYTRVVSRDVKAPPFLLLPYVLDREPKMSPKQAAFISKILSNKRRPDFSEYKVDLD